MNSKSKIAQRLFQLALLVGMAVSVKLFNSMPTALILAAVFFGSAIYWEVRDTSHAGARDEKTTEKAAGRPSKAAFQLVSSCLLGALMAVLVGLADVETTRTSTFPLTLVGVPFFVPLGTFVLGFMIANGYLLGLRLSGGHPVYSDLYLCIGFSVLGMMLDYVFLYWSGQATSFTDFVGDYLRHGPSWLGIGRDYAHAGLTGPASPAWITPPIQLFGFVFGSVVAFWRVRPDLGLGPGS